jgi:hypothetical protein
MVDELTAAELGAMGGKARAESLTAEERSEQARRAVQARWNAELPQATHAGRLRIAGREIICAVLDDGTRVLNQETFLTAIGRAAKAKAGTGSTRMNQVDELPPFLAAKNLKPFIYDDLRRSTSPVIYRTETGGRAFGYKADLLPEVCKVYIRADEAGQSNKGQAHIVAACRIIHDALSKVGIIALVDEATGYQYERLRDELQRILERYVSKELARYSRVFEQDFYEHIHRLKGWKYNPDSTKRSHAIARLTVDLTYDRIHPDLLKELKQVRKEKGKSFQKLHQWLTADPTGGHPRLKQHAEGVTALLSVAKNWLQFQDWIDRRYPKVNETRLLPFPEPEDEELATLDLQGK